MKVKDDAALWFETQGQDIQDFEVPPEVNEHDAEADGDDTSLRTRCPTRSRKRKTSG